MALTREGTIFAWGEATYGQLGLDDTKDLPKNTDSKPYQPFPTKVVALQYKKIKVVEILAVADKTMKYGLPKNLNNTTELVVYCPKLRVLCSPSCHRKRCVYVVLFLYSI